MSGKNCFDGSILEKCGKIWKNGRFSGRIRPDWGNTGRADMAGLGSIGYKILVSKKPHVLNANHKMCVTSLPWA